jgi:hypothetical protein
MNKMRLFIICIFLSILSIGTLQGFNNCCKYQEKIEKLIEKEKQDRETLRNLTIKYLRKELGKPQE